MSMRVSSMPLLPKYNDGMVMDKSTGKMLHVQQSAMSDMNMKE